MPTPPPVSVFMPIRNEERHLRRSVAGVLDQDYDGELEVVLAVGPSDDRTWEVATALAGEDPRVRVVKNPTGRTPAGLNIAIAAARFDILVRVDGHGELSEGYIATVVRLLAETGAANVGGRMHAVGESPFEEAVAAAYNSPFGLGGGGFHLDETPAGPAPTVFLGAFRRDALEAVGGYDETMFRAQDWELNHRLRDAGYVVWYSPELTVTYRPRSTVVALAKQFWHTGQWRREVIRRYPDTASLRYLAPPLAVAGLAAGTVGGLTGWLLGNRWLRLLLAAPIVYGLFLAAATVSLKGLSPAARLRMPLVLAVMHTCWGAGFIRGVA